MTFSPAAIPLPADQASLDARAAARVRASGSSFFWSMRVLPGRQRRAIYAVYAFCREVDDIADSSASSAERLAALARWRPEIEAAYAGTARHWAARALTPAIRTFDLDRSAFHAILDGVERDAAESMVAPSEALLRQYCSEVAGAVGLLSLEIFARQEPGLDRRWRSALAASMGEALQLTNILRDVGEDAVRGRLYLPREQLKAAGLPTAPAPALLHDPALRLVMARLGERTRERYAEAESLLAQAPRRRLRACRLMLATYRALLDRLESAGWPVAGPRQRLAPAMRIVLLLRHGLL